MTAEQLASLGYQPGQSESTDLSDAQAAITPQDLQQFYAQAGNPQAGTPDISQLNPQQTFIDPAVLNSVASLPTSDPNGFVSTPSGQPVANPYDSLNPSADPRVPAPAPGQTPSAPNATYDTGAASVPSQEIAPPAQGNQNIATAIGFPKFSEWARASGLPRQVMPDERKVILEKYLEQQKDFLARQDPEKLLKIQKDKVDLKKSEMDQSDAVNKKLDAVPELQNNIQLLDDLVNHKGLSSAVGAKDASFLFGLKKDPLAGTDAADFMSRVEQVQGKNFLAAFNQLKGAGQITEIEGAKATAAMARLGTNQSEGEFKKSVAELRGILKAGLNRTRDRLGVSGEQSVYDQAKPSAPVIRTTPSGTFQSLGDGRWVQIK